MSHHILAPYRLALIRTMLGACCLLAVPVASCARDATAEPVVRSNATLRPVSLPADSVVDDNAANEDLSLHFVGRLAHPMGYYAHHGRELYTALRSKPWHGHVRTRHCAQCAPGETTTMKVQAISNVHHDPLTGLPANGVVVGRMMNLGNRTDLGTNIPADGFFMRHEYFYIITDLGDSTRAKLWIARVAILRVLGPRDEVYIALAQQQYVKCPNHSEPPRATSDGDFRNCPLGASPFLRVPGGPPHRPPGEESGTRPHLVAFRESARLAPPGDPLAWFACDGGCCTAPWPPSADSTAVASIPSRRLAAR